MLLTRRRRLSIGVSVCVLVCSAALGGEGCTPPHNETCDGALVFSDADLPFEATGPLGCVNDVVDRPYMDVFFRFDCTRSGTYLLHMCPSSGDTYIRVYSGGCGWVDGEELAVDDDSCPGSPPNADPLLQVFLEAGQSYWIEVGTNKPDGPTAPPPNSPYLLSVAFEVDPPGPAGNLDVEAGPEWQLQIAKFGADLLLEWGHSCIVDDTDYAVYSGQLETLGVHAPLTCSTGGAPSFVTPLPQGNVYFLINAENDFVGGSYGTTSAGAQRPKGDPYCLPRFFTTCP